LDAECHDCNQVVTTAVTTASVLLGILLASAGLVVIAKMRAQDALRRVEKVLRAARKYWLRAGIRFKIKTLVGIWQCFGAIPSVYDVQPPPGAEKYDSWLYVVELPSLGVDLGIPGTCIGSCKASLDWNP
jgi:hypothetical protein